MAPFHEGSLTYLDADGKERERPDWAILQYGPVALFRQPAILAETIAWLERYGYTVVQANCAACESEQEVLWAIGQVLVGGMLWLGWQVLGVCMVLLMWTNRT